MKVRVLAIALFIIWAAVIMGLSVFSWTNNDILLSMKLTSTGFVMHFFAYFTGMLLCYYALGKKNISFVLWAGLIIFLFSLALEIVQIYLPKRTFNIYDAIANGSGILVFYLVRIAYSKIFNVSGVRYC